MRLIRMREGLLPDGHATSMSTTKVANYLRSNTLGRSYFWPSRTYEDGAPGEAGASEMKERER